MEYTIRFPAARIKFDTDGTVTHRFQGSRLVTVEPNTFKARKHASKLGIPQEAWRVIHEFLLHQISVEYGNTLSFYRFEAGKTSQPTDPLHELEQKRAWAVEYFAFGVDWEDEDTLEQMREDGIDIEALADKVRGLVCLVAAE